jgi:hypothetical protein
VMTTHDVVKPNPVDIYLIAKWLESGIERPVADWIAKAGNDKVTNDSDGNTDNNQN